MPERPPLRSGLTGLVTLQAFSGRRPFFLTSHPSLLDSSASICPAGQVALTSFVSRGVVIDVVKFGECNEADVDPIRYDVRRPLPAMVSLGATLAIAVPVVVVARGRSPMLVTARSRMPADNTALLVLTAFARNNPSSVVRATLVDLIVRCGGRVIVQKRSWHEVVARSFRHVTLGRAVFVMVFSAVTAAQIVLQPVSLAYWSGGQLFRALADNFVEGLIVAWSMFLGGSILLAWTRQRGLMHIVMMALAIVLFALIGCLIGFCLTYDSGFFPPLSFIASSTLRWSVIGGLLFVIDSLIDQQRQNANQLRESEARVASLGRQAAEARLQLMQAQIEPHFLFNTLANVKRLCATDPDGGAELFSHLMVYLQAALPTLRESESTLAMELNLARSFLAVLQIRMGSRLRFTIDVPQSLLPLPFPSMALLTLVENAVKHGLAPAQQGGSISIRAELLSGELCVTVADTGVGFSAKGGSGIGIANTRSRLAAVYGDRAELRLSANAPSGVVASITVPFTAAPDAAGLFAAGVSP